ncbi:hypothetical protein BR63_05785 [Thermanaerosceptrum fracticalcis]|uniref:Uncharacterized protein n=1 Tax=Thermanaerosceptrum fracticalcis TaxID=1712410 RepID=A0A7G6E1B5_THEFR|nr:hypothetical protein [Thermanaerosceptrum fracticalcis]QNB45869.1 hypothetical protein BR63_05785 [Thermanaerosceptrum fracticalcis]
MLIYIPDKEAAGYLLTLAVAAAGLPGSAHPIHYARLRELREQIEREILKKERVAGEATNV